MRLTLYVLSTGGKLFDLKVGGIFLAETLRHRSRKESRAVAYEEIVSARLTLTIVSRSHRFCPIGVRTLNPRKALVGILFVGIENHRNGETPIGISDHRVPLHLWRLTEVSGEIYPRNVRPHSTYCHARLP